MARRERKRKQSARMEAAQAAFFARTIVEQGPMRRTGVENVDGVPTVQFERDVTYSDGSRGVIYSGEPLSHKADADSEAVS